MLGVLCARNYNYVSIKLGVLVYFKAPKHQYTGAHNSVHCSHTNPLYSFQQTTLEELAIYNHRLMSRSQEYIVCTCNNKSILYTACTMYHYYPFNLHVSAPKGFLLTSHIVMYFIVGDLVTKSQTMKGITDNFLVQQSPEPN